MSKPISELARKVRVVLENRISEQAAEPENWRVLFFLGEDWEGLMMVLNWLETDSGIAAPERIEAVIAAIPED